MNRKLEILLVLTQTLAVTLLLLQPLVFMNRAEAEGLVLNLPQQSQQDEPEGPLPGLVGTSIADIAWSGRHLWVATERGLARLDLRQQSGLNAEDWVTYGEANGMGRGAVSALAVIDSTIWVATLVDSTEQAGNGLSFSRDAGDHWQHIPNNVIFDPRVPGFEQGPFTQLQNACFGLAIDGETIWATFFAGSVVRSRDGGINWERVLPDGADQIVFVDSDTAADSLQLVADSLSLAGAPQAAIDAARAEADSVLSQSGLHRTFSVAAYDDTVWIGTASGIARSFDGGDTWTNLKARLDPSGALVAGGLGANWVVALERQVRTDGVSVVWAGTRLTTDPDGQVETFNYSEDDGETWNSGGPTFAWDFAFSADSIWASSEDGVFVSADGGQMWENVVVEDEARREQLRGQAVGAETVPMDDGTTLLWVGASNGLGRSDDGGQSWSILSFPVKTATVDTREIVGLAGLIEPNTNTYAAPNPFSPSRDDRARLVYSLARTTEVTIDIYDVASRHVRALISAEPREGPRNHGDNWDGKDDDGDTVANGVYFFRVETSNGHRAFGKVVVLN